MLSHDIEASLSTFGKSICFEAPGFPPLTGHALADDVARCASALLSLGVAQGDRIVVASEKTAAAVPLALACLQTGAVVIPAASTISQADFGTLIDDAQPTVVVGPARLLARTAPKVRMSRVRTALVLEPDGTGTWRDLCLTQRPGQTSVLVRPSDIALLSYGADARAVAFTHAALSRHVERARCLLGLQKGDRLVHEIRAWGDVTAMAILAGAWMSRAQVVWASREHGISGTVVAGDPPAAAGWPAPLRGALHLNGQSYLALPEAGIIAVQRETGDIELIEKLDAVVEAGTLVIVDDALFAGYWRRTAESARALQSGRFNTGLVARREIDGRILITGQV